ncbi:MAG: RsmD family RNA methyltransferase [Flavobacteriales bacterium]|jgi:16S rRNA (guanine(966)-N(2))-methyltransferase RsmD|nr:RsmD family RNA methyltransferase [Flavobacteriales bacterium]
MRIIGGTLKGRRFSPPRHFKGRPTTDFGREGLFNLLRSRIELEGVEALDLFAGSGAVSFELASRGAVSVTSVEKDAGSCRYIHKQAQDFGFDAIRVLRADAFAFLGKAVTQFDLVFADPPYTEPKLPELPAMVASAGLVAKGGLFVLEHGDRQDFSKEDGFVEMRKYGHVHFSFFDFHEALSED